MKDADLTPASSNASALQWRGQTFPVLGEQAGVAVRPALEAHAKLSGPKPSPSSADGDADNLRQSRLQALEKLTAAFAKAKSALTGLAGGPSGGSLSLDVALLQLIHTKLSC